MASGVNFGTQQYFGFDPRTIPGCALWLDAADSNTITLSGSSVTAWNDKSGNGWNATQTVSGNRPTYNASQGTVSFTGSSSSFLNLPDGTFPSGNGAYSILAAVTPVSGYHMFGSGIGAQNQALFGGWNLPTGLFDAWFNVDFGASYSQSITNQSTLVGFFYTQSLRYLMTNGVVIGSQASSNRNSSSLNNSIGGFLPQNLYSTFFLREFFVYSRALTVSEYQQIEGYLAWKWALQANLPSSHPFRPAPPIMRIFQPVDVSGAALWLDAADASTLTLSGSSVTAWNDKSGNGRHATGGVSPTRATNGVVFNGTSQYLATTYSAVPTAETFFGVATWTGTVDRNYCIIGTSAWDGRNFNVQQYSGTVRIVKWDRWGVAGYAPTTGVQPNVQFLASGIFTGSSGQTAFNGGSLSASQNFSFAGSGTTNIGAGVLADYFSGTINEVIVYSTVLTDADRQQVEGYLAWKWGLQGSLPTTHPYYRMLPSTPLFSPPQLSGLVLWMDPTDSTTLTLSGSSVTQWRDKSASAATFTTVNANPTYTASLINGLPGLDLTNASAFISSTTQTLTSSLTLAMILVVKSGIGAWGSFFTHGNRDLDFAMERNSISTGTTLQFQTANDNSGANITFTTDQVSLYLGTMTTGTSRFFSRFGGGTTTTATGTNSSTITTGLQTIRIGRSDVGENCNSFIGEIVYYNRVLTTLERQELEGYLAWKWGLQASLPSTHPFAKVRP